MCDNIGKYFWRIWLGLVWDPAAEDCGDFQLQKLSCWFDTAKSAPNQKQGKTLFQIKEKRASETIYDLSKAKTQNNLAIYSIRRSLRIETKP